MATIIYDKNNSVVDTLSVEAREVVKLEDVSPYVKDAFLAIEDKQFYSHHGLNFKGIARAVITTFLKGRATQGGSSITQQLAKNAFLTPEKTFSRKVKEAILTYQIERTYTKDEIVTLAELHDLGKGITKKPSQSRGIAHDYFVEIHGSHSMFANHQYVGAVYALVKFKDDLSVSHLKIVEAIYQHMKAHDGISAKAIKKDKLDDDTLALIYDFAKIDSASRIIDEEIYEKYMSLLGKKG